ncbi:uncharacterized protein IWZ02DRAFT_503035 [Phyllosticta citriasiana]|uniref:uncharacterized protein n=1 Tax=Phyllosticta citriasiana TaxID=595635 RepID=UPI0030FD7510
MYYYPKIEAEQDGHHDNPTCKGYAKWYYIPHRLHLKDEEKKIFVDEWLRRLDECRRHGPESQKLVPRLDSDEIEPLEDDYEVEKELGDSSEDAKLKHAFVVYTRRCRRRTMKATAAFLLQMKTTDVTWNFPYHWDRTDCFLEYCKEIPKESPDLGLLQTFKTVDNETQDLFFKKNHFSFTNLEALYRFCDGLSQEQRSWIREVTICSSFAVLDSLKVIYNLSISDERPAMVRDTVLPLENLHMVHFATYIEFGFHPQPEIRDITLSEFQFAIHRETYKKFVNSDPETKYSVTVDCDSSLLVCYHHVYPELDYEHLRSRLGVTDEDKKQHIEAFEPMIVE